MPDEVSLIDVVRLDNAYDQYKNSVISPESFYRLLRERAWDGKPYPSQFLRGLREKAIADAELPKKGGPPSSFQEGVATWVVACFGPEIAADREERGQRFVEGALELVQACGGSREDCHSLVDYVFDRPVGEVGQEVGGVMITLAALCGAHGVDLDKEASDELKRVWGKIEQVRAKQAGKPKFSALPQ